MDTLKQKVNTAEEFEAAASSAKKNYAKPALKTLGKLSTLTLGGSAGIADSGMPTGPEQPPT